MTDILDMVPDLRRARANSGGEYAGPCPWCGGPDRFRVWPEHPSGHARWWCRQCSRHGDTIDLLRQRDGMWARARLTAAKRLRKHSPRQQAVLPPRSAPAESGIAT